MIPAALRGLIAAALLCAAGRALALDIPGHATPVSAAPGEAHLAATDDGRLWLGDARGLHLLSLEAAGAARRIDGIGPVIALSSAGDSVLAADLQRLWQVSHDGQSVLGPETLRPRQLRPASLDCRCWWLRTEDGLALVQAVADRWSVVALAGATLQPEDRLLDDVGGRLWLLGTGGVYGLDTQALLKGLDQRIGVELPPQRTGAEVTSSEDASAEGASARTPEDAAALQPSSTAGSSPAFWRGFGLASLLALLIGAALRALQRRHQRLRHIQRQFELDQLVQRRTADLETANRTLRDLADTDSLTGVSNRRHFDRLLLESFERSLLTGRRLSVLLLDVDHFKAFNDSHGHLGGDQALRDLGQTLQKAVRNDTMVARYGGEEFAVITPVSLREAAGLAERLRRTVEAECGITISVGVASLSAANDRDQPALLARADRALYAAKAAGRNRVVSDPPHLPRDSSSGRAPPAPARRSVPLP